MQAQTFEPFKLIKNDLKIVESRFKNELKSDNDLVQQVLNYVVNAGGKRVRPALALLISRALSPELTTNHYKVAEITEMIHTATLMHDDVIDGSDKRRGVYTVNNVWNNKIAVISGDYLLSMASIRLAELGNLEVVDIFANVLKEICVGEIQQDLDRFNVEIQWDTYLKKSIRKTATLFAATAKSAAIISGASRTIIDSLHTYGLKLGLVFQIADDLLNVIGNPETVGKNAHDDIYNGLITAPTLYAFESSYGNSIKELISKRFEENTTLPQVIDLIHKSGAIQQTQNLIDQYIREAVSCLDHVQESPFKEELIRVAYYAGKREK